MFVPSIPYPGSRRSLFRILSKAEQRALIQLAQHFLQQKRLIARQDFVLDDLKSARLALLFCLPVLNLGYEWLDGFHDVLIYPAPLMVDDEWQDAFSLTHHQRTALAGQRWQ